MITKISAYIMPFVILIIVGYGMYKKSDNYDNFVNGAEAVSYTHLTLPTNSRV
mgnify:CR=1 FL=1